MSKNSNAVWDDVYDFPNSTSIEKGFYMVTMHNSTFESWGWKQRKGITLIQSDGVTFNGDDTIALFNPNGTIVDLYGEHGVDGTGKPWFVFASNECPL